MLIPFGVLSAAGAEVGIVSDYELISTTILGSSAASVTFSSLGDYSSTYKHLQIRFSARSDRSGTNNDNLSLRLNGDSGSNYAFHSLAGDGGSAFTARGTSATRVDFGQMIAGATTTAQSFGSGFIDILDVYATKNKTVRGLAGLNGSNSWIFLTGGVWINTGSVTSLTFGSVSGSNLISGSRFSLYGIKG